MNKIKKLVLSLSVVLAMAIAFVVGLVGLNHNKSVNNSNVKQVEDVGSEIKSPTKPARPVRKTLTFSEGEVSIQGGSGDINFEYNPDNTQGATSVAYEYCFNNPMTDPMAINLKSIDASGVVTISYAYGGDNGQPLTEITDTTTIFEAQTIQTYKSKYIYVVVTANSDIPTNFQSNVVWYQGRAGEIEIYNTDGTQNSTQTVVKGQPISEPNIEVTDNAEVKWYLDAECTTPATFPLNETQPLYVKVLTPNLPSDWLKLEDDHYVVTKGTSALQSDLIIPSTYNGLEVTHIAEATECTEDGDYLGLFYNKGVTSVILPGTITNIGTGAFSMISSITNVDLSNCTNLTTIGECAFNTCGLIQLDLTNCTSLIAIEGSAFAYCESLTSITLSSSLTSVGEGAFQSCTGLTSVNLNACTSLISISNSAFRSCRGLTSIDLSGCTSLTSIGTSAFQFCYALTNIVISESVSKIGNYAFEGCSKEASITFNDTTTWYYTNIQANWNNMTGGTEIEVTDPITNASFFRSTHYKYYWYKL